MVKKPFLVAALVKHPFLMAKNTCIYSFLLVILSGCTTIEVVAPLPCPDRPTLTPLTEDLQLQMPEDALYIIGENQLALKAYAKKLEARASCK